MGRIIADRSISADPSPAAILGVEPTIASLITHDIILEEKKKAMIKNTEAQPLVKSDGKSRRTRFPIFWCAIVALVAWVPTARAAPPRPNIIFILVDDMGYGDCGVLYQNRRSSTEPKLLTPGLDRMAAEGTILSNHYCGSPVCAPSRASILQGMNQGHCDNRDNQFDWPLPANHTLGTVMRQAGYYTAVIGKWGLAGKQPPWPAHPLNRGFDTFYGFLRHQAAHNHYPGNGGGIYDGFIEVAQGLDGIYTADLFTARAKSLIVEHHQRHPDQPLFLYLAYTLPHFAMQLPPGPYPKGGGIHGGVQWPLVETGKADSYIYPAFRDQPWPEKEKCFASMMHRLDDCVGDVLQLLRDLNMDRDTLVVFTSDNGPHNEGNDPSFFGSWGPFDGIKRDLFEGGWREPTFVWWPGTVPAGRTDPIVSAQYDWVATFAQAAGVVVPDRTDGISLLPTLTGHPDQQARHDYLYSEYQGVMIGPLTRSILDRHGYTKRGQEQAVRIGDFVGVRYNITSPTDPLRLYNVVEDPKEEHELSGVDPKYQDVLARMQDLLVTARTPDPHAPRPYDDALLPAVPQPSRRGGLSVQIYHGRWPWLPAFRMMPALDPPSITPNFRLPAIAESDGFGAAYTGWFHVPADGKYTLAVSSDSGVDCWVHDDLVIDDDFNHLPAPKTGSVRLQAGWHPLRLDYRHDPFAKAAHLNVVLRGPDNQQEPLEGENLATISPTTQSSPK
jgi:arylsulfatase A-like enzyme